MLNHYFKTITVNNEFLNVLCLLWYKYLHEANDKSLLCVCLMEGDAHLETVLLCGVAVTYLQFHSQECTFKVRNLTKNWTAVRYAHCMPFSHALLWEVIIILFRQSPGKKQRKQQSGRPVFWLIPPKRESAVKKYYTTTISTDKYQKYDHIEISFPCRNETNKCHFNRNFHCLILLLVVLKSFMHQGHGRCAHVGKEYMKKLPNMRTGKMMYWHLIIKIPGQI